MIEHDVGERSNSGEGEDETSVLMYAMEAVQND